MQPRLDEPGPPPYGPGVPLPRFRWRRPSGFRSFQSRILVFVLVLLTVLPAVVSLIVDAAATRSARQNLRDEVLVGDRVFVRLMRARSERLLEAARLLSADFAFKQAFSTQDAGTIRSAVDNHRARIGADVVTLVSLDHEVVADTLRRHAQGQPFQFPQLLDAAEEKGEASAIVAIDRRYYQIVVVPLLAPVPVAWIGVGFVIDDRLAEELERLTLVHVSFVSPEGEGRWAIVASTMPISARQELMDQFGRLSGPTAPTFSLQLGGHEYLAHVAIAGDPREGTISAILAKSTTESLAAFERLRAEMLVLFGAWLLVSLVGGMIIARTVSRPVQTLVHGVRRIEQGDYGHRVEVAQRDEIGELASAVNHMTARIAEREEALRKSEEQLRQAQKMEALGRLAGGVAHDFNNLLTIISGRTEIVLDGLADRDPLRRDVEIIDRTAQRASALTRQLLAFNRKQVLQTKVLDLNAIVTGMTAMLERLIGEDILLEVLLQPSLGRVRGDAGQIEQILMNLAVNARDAMPGGGRLTLETTNVDLSEAFVRDRPDASPGPHVRLRVRDTGTGLSPEARRHLFEPFFTTKAPGKGTGLGLSAAYGIVRQHNGHIEVEDNPVPGTSFTVYLPRLDAPADVAAPPAAVTPLHGAETMLLVEDEDEVRSLLVEKLRGYGYTVLAARHPGEALLVAERHAGPIHILVTDVVMPHMSGRELAARLTVVRPEIKTLYISGYTGDALLPPWADGPDIAFLQKPFSHVELARKLREILGGSPSEQPSAGPGGTRSER